MKKRMLSMLLAVLMLVSMLSACGENTEEAISNSASEEIASQ